MQCVNVSIVYQIYYVCVCVCVLDLSMILYYMN